MTGIIDYKAGNSKSVENACRNIGVEAKLVKTKEELSQCDQIILPGVGSAQATMDSLRELEIIPLLERRVLEEKIPFLGICIGLQILFEKSEEGDVDCLGWLKGTVVKYRTDRVKVPQIGWNKVVWKKDSSLMKDVGEQYFYFVNSYHAICEEAGDVLGEADYDGAFPAFVERGNIFAAQCHIEKSGPAGLKVLKNFCECAGRGSGCE